jgi:hypothetical protein
MAQINLGSIKFNWKGSYSGATAYVVDDVVESSGSSYICIAATTGNAPPNATYWEQMSSAGTNGTDGTDLGTTLTTQGDIVYRDASGLARLGAGTSGQFLKTQGTGANPIWSDNTAGVIASYSVTDGNRFSITGTNSGTQQVGNLAITLTPASTSSKFLLMSSFIVNHDNYGSQMSFMRGSTDLATAIAVSPSNRIPGFFSQYTPSADYTSSGSMIHIDSPNTTSSITYKVGTKVRSTSTWRFNFNPNNQDTDDHISGVSTLNILELGV